MYACTYIYTLISGVQLLRTNYSTILHSLPTNYENTLYTIQNYLTDDQICCILSSPDHTAANKLILDYLLERVKSADHLMKLCDQFQQIMTSSPGLDFGSLMDVVSKLRLSM